MLYIAYLLYSCYNSNLSIKVKEELCIGFTQKNLIEFQVQSIYLIYTRLIVCIILNLVYPKEYVLSIRLTYSKV